MDAVKRAQRDHAAAPGGGALHQPNQPAPGRVWEKRHPLQDPS